MVVPCMDALVVVNLNLFLSAVILNFAPLAVISTVLTVQPKCLLN